MRRAGWLVVVGLVVAVTVVAVLVARFRGGEPPPGPGDAAAGAATGPAGGEAAPKASEEPVDVSPAARQDPPPTLPAPVEQRDSEAVDPAWAPDQERALGQRFAEILPDRARTRGLSCATRTCAFTLLAADDDALADAIAALETDPVVSAAQGMVLAAVERDPDGPRVVVRLLFERPAKEP